MTLPAFLGDKGVQGALLVFVLGAVFVAIQIKVARQQLFASLAGQRQQWLRDFDACIGDRIDEIREELKGPLPRYGAEVLSRMWRLQDDARWLFGPEVVAAGKAIEDSLSEHARIRWAFKEASEDRTSGAKANAQREWMENDRERNALRRELAEAIHPYVYVGDVKRTLPLSKRLSALRASRERWWLAAKHWAQKRLS